MVTIVVILNLAIALCCFYVVRWVGRWRRRFARAANALEAAERHTHRVLRNAPEAIRQGQLGTYQLRQEFQALELKLLRARQVLSLLGMGWFLWQQQGRSRQRSPRRPFARF
jgi:hypothetical protein